MFTITPANTLVFPSLLKVFKITDGDCYELYGWNEEGKKVEIYYDPVTGDTLKTEIED